MLPTRMQRPLTVATRRWGQWIRTYRIIDTNTTEQPAATTARAAAASPTLPATANHNEPAPVVRAPSTASRRDPSASASTPEGSCSNAYTQKNTVATSDTSATPVWNDAASATTSTVPAVRLNSASA